MHYPAGFQLLKYAAQYCYRVMIIRHHAENRVTYIRYAADFQGFIVSI